MPLHSVTDLDAGPVIGRLGGRLRRARERRFVGRDAELRLVCDALAAPDDVSTVVYVHGPGGVGKSSLLRAAQARADDRGVPTARVDLRTIESAPAAFCATLSELLGRSAPAVARGDLGVDRCLLLIDAYDWAGALDHWLREQYLPIVPAGTVVMIAGRAGPGPAWTSDAGWRDLLTVLPLRNLEPDAVHDLLTVEGIPAGMHDRLLEVSHGHPLALNLLVDVLRQATDQGRGGSERPVADLAGSPDVVQALLESFVSGVPGPVHRSALQVAALARSTTEDLLRAALGIDDARPLFDWLRGLSFVEETRHGLFPHDLARDVLVSDAQWRDPAGSLARHRSVHDWTVGQLAESFGRSAFRQDDVADWIFLHRNNPVAAALWDWRSFGDVHADRLQPADPEQLVALTTRHQGEASAALVEYWIARQPEAFAVFRGTDGTIVGFTATLALHLATEDDLAADPGARAMWQWALRHSPPRPGEEVFAARFYLDAEQNQTLPSRSVNSLTISSTLVWMTGRRRPCWEFVCWVDEADGAPMMDYIGFRRLSDADFVVDGRQHAVFGHDWRRRDPEAWMAFMAAKETAREVEPIAAPVVEVPATAALSRAEFGQAAKQALRDLHRPDALARNPLQAARLLTGCGDVPQAQRLAAVLRDAVAALGPHPRDRRMERVLDRTYLRPAGTQEAAAEVLGLPMSTYRRDLAAGTDRVAEWLWQRELYGWAEEPAVDSAY